MRDALRNMTTVLSSVSTPMIVLLLLTVIAPLPWLLVQNATKKATQPGAPNLYAWQVKGVLDRMTDQKQVETRNAL
jgi:hypothetical protein